jgi:Domain of unknown function (DUF4168)
MTLKSKVIFALASATWLAAPAALSQEPPIDTPPSSHDIAEPTQPSTTRESAPSSAAAEAKGASPEASAFSDQKLEQFATAFVEVRTIQQKAMSDLQQTSDPAAADKVKANAETAMIGAVERSGLQIEEFNQIVESMASNIDVRNRVAEKLQKRAGG